MSELPFDQLITALGNWSRGIPDIRAREPEALITRVIDAMTAATQRAEAAEAEVEEVREQRDYWAIAAHKLADAMKVDEALPDQAKADAEHWKGQHALTFNLLGGLRVECEALRKDAALLREFVSSDEIAMTYQTMGQYRAALLKFHTAAMAVQPTTGGEHE